MFFTRKGAILTNVHKNIISFLLGSSFAYVFVLLFGLVSALPVPGFLRPYNESVVLYYSNILVVLFSAMLSFVVVLGARKAFSLFTRQNLLFFTLPIVLFLSYLFVFLNFVVASFMYAAIPTLLVALLLSNSAQKT